MAAAREGVKSGNLSIIDELNQSMEHLALVHKVKAAQDADKKKASAPLLLAGQSGADLAKAVAAFHAGSGVSAEKQNEQAELVQKIINEYKVKADSLQKERDKARAESDKEKVAKGKVTAELAIEKEKTSQLRGKIKRMEEELRKADENLAKAKKSAETDKAALEARVAKLVGLQETANKQLENWDRRQREWEATETAYNGKIDGTLAIIAALESELKEIDNALGIDREVIHIENLAKERLDTIRTVVAKASFSAASAKEVKAREKDAEELRAARQEASNLKEVVAQLQNEKVVLRGKQEMANQDLEAQRALVVQLRKDLTGAKKEGSRRRVGVIDLDSQDVGGEDLDGSDEAAARERAAGDEKAKAEEEKRVRERVAQQIQEKAAAEAARQKAAQEEEAVKKAKEKAEAEARDRAAQDEANQKARAKATQEARDKAAQDKAAQEAREKAAREAKDKAAQDKAAQEAREKAAQEARDKAEKEGKDKAERERQAALAKAAADAEKKAEPAPLAPTGAKEWTPRTQSLLRHLNAVRHVLGKDSLDETSIDHQSNDPGDTGPPTEEMKILKGIPRFNSRQYAQKVASLQNYVDGIKNDAKKLREFEEKFASRYTNNYDGKNIWGGGAPVPAQKKAFVEQAPLYIKDVLRAKTRAYAEFLDWFFRALLSRPPGVNEDRRTRLANDRVSSFKSHVTMLNEKLEAEFQKIVDHWNDPGESIANIAIDYEPVLDFEEYKELNRIRAIAARDLNPSLPGDQVVEKEGLDKSALSDDEAGGEEEDDAGGHVLRAPEEKRPEPARAVAPAAAADAEQPGSGKQDATPAIIKEATELKSQLASLKTLREGRSPTDQEIAVFDRLKSLVARYKLEKKFDFKLKGAFGYHEENGTVADVDVESRLDEEMRRMDLNGSYSEQMDW